MKTIKKVAEISGVSIRTLRYYDEIGLLKPTQLTNAGYRLYDGKALEKLQQIMFFRELEIPLLDIKKIIENPGYNKEQILKTQKALLEKKRNRLNGIIELISDVMKGENSMSFEAFNEDDIQKIIDHTLKNMSKDALEKQIKIYGNMEKFQEQLAAGLKNQQETLIKWYGSKEKAIESVVQSTGDNEILKQQQLDNEEIYKQLMEAKETENADLEKKSIARLAQLYKAMFNLDNARAILLDLAKEYREYEKMAEAVDNQFGKGCAEHVALAIERYYGV